MTQTLAFVDYETLAKRYLINLVRRWGHPMAIVDDPDAHDTIIRFMIDADTKFDGRGSLEGFRWQYARYGYLEYLTKNRFPKSGKKQRHKRMVSLSAFKRADMEKSVELAVDNRDPSEGVVSSELRDKIMNSNLSNYEKESIIGIYYNGETQEEISQRIGVARGYISMLLKTGLKKLRTTLKEYE